jgi:hypothetical protein
MAYASPGACYVDIRGTSKAAENTREAYEVRERVT